MAVLDLAIGVAALYSRRGELHIGALAASQIILIAWQFTASVAPWPRIALLSALGIAAMGFVWFLLARRVEIQLTDASGVFFGAASVIASVFGMGVAITGTVVRGTPEVTLLIVAYAFLLCLML